MTVSSLDACSFWVTPTTDLSPRLSCGLRVGGQSTFSATGPRSSPSDVWVDGMGVLFQAAPMEWRTRWMGQFWR